MIAVASALGPIFLLIAAGWALRSFVFRAEAFWEAIETITYFVLFPALLIASIAAAQVGGPVVVPALTVLAVVMLAVAAILVAARKRLALDGPAFTSVFQGSIRFNTYVGLAAAATLYGTLGTALLAIALALMVPLANVLSVAVLARHAESGVENWTAMLVALSGNPLIIASLVGIAVAVSGMPLPPVIAPTLDILGKAALPLGLLAVGAGLNLRAVSAKAAAVAVSAALKLALSPLLAWLGTWIAGLDGAAAAVVVLFAALPPAPSAFILARRLGGDHELMAAVITVHTLLAAITLPVVLTLGG